MNQLTAGFVSFVAFVALGQTVTKVNQGQPGTQGPWPVSVQNTTLADGGLGPLGVSRVLPYVCGSIRNTADFLPDGGFASFVPTDGGMPGRAYLYVCNSQQNVASTLLKCRADGVAPTASSGSPGEVLSNGDCAMYPTLTPIRCIAITNPAIVHTFECK